MESVWDYPRPPRLEHIAKHIVIRFGGAVIADTKRAVRVLETSHPPVYYLPIADVVAGVLQRASGSSFCEWKGTAHYFDVVSGDSRADGAAWGYDDPTPAFLDLRGRVAFYAAPMESCTVDGEIVMPQPGGFYGGWITKDLVGPFKGEPGSRGW
jgi:uncharacterized protein (DUF427 family)